MRTYLHTLLLSLLALTSLAQPYTTKKLNFKLDGVTIKGTAFRDLAKYPRGAAGFARLKADAEKPASTRPFNITITSGARAGQVLLAATTTPTNPPTGAVVYRGGLDYAGRDEVRGWAFIDSDRAKSAQVEIYFDGVKVGTITTSQNRPDVAAAFNVSGYTNFGFSFPTPEPYKSGSSQISVTLKGVNSSTNTFDNSPRTIAGSTTTTPPSNTTTTPSTPAVVDNFDYTPYPNTDTSDPFPVFESSRIRIQLALRDQNNTATPSNSPGLGGAIYNIYDKAEPGFNWLFNPRYLRDGSGGAPKGASDYLIGSAQGMGMCLYQNPTPHFASQFGGTDKDPGLGYNPNEGGDDARYSGQRLAYGRKDNGWYIKSTPRLYEAIGALATPVIYEKWADVSGIALRQHYRLTFNRTDGSGIHKRQESLRIGPQEMPCYYTNAHDGRTKIVWYDGDDPYSNGALKEYNYHSGVPRQMRRNALYPTEPFIAVCNQDKSRCTALLLHNNQRAQVGIFETGSSDADWISTSGTNVYIGDNPYLLIDDQTTIYKYSETLVGSISEIRQYVYSHPYRPSDKPEFRFNRADRLGWTYNAGDAGDRHTWDDGVAAIAQSGGWKVYFDRGKDGNIASPAVAWNANTYKKIYVNLSTNVSSGQWRIRWRKPRQTPAGDPVGEEETYEFPEGSADRDSQKMLFNVPGDSQTRTVEINLMGLGAWSGRISEITIDPHPTAGFTYPNGEWAKINWISTNPNGPQ